MLYTIGKNKLYNRKKTERDWPNTKRVMNRQKRGKIDFFALTSSKIDHLVEQLSKDVKSQKTKVFEGLTLKKFEKKIAKNSKNC